MKGLMSSVFLLYVMFSLTHGGNPYADSDGNTPPYKLDALKKKLYEYLHNRQLDKLRKESKGDTADDTSKRGNEEQNGDMGNMDKLDLLQKKVSEYLEKKGIDLMNDKREEAETILNEDENMMVENRQFLDERLMAAEDESEEGEEEHKLRQRISELEMGLKRQETRQNKLIDALRGKLGENFFRKNQLDEIEMQIKNLWKYVMRHEDKFDMQEETEGSNGEMEEESMTGEEMGEETEEETTTTTTTSATTTTTAAAATTTTGETTTNESSTPTTTLEGTDEMVQRKIAKLEKILVEDLKREVGELKEKRGYTGKK